MPGKLTVSLASGTSMVQSAEQSTLSMMVVIGPWTMRRSYFPFAAVNVVESVFQVLEAFCVPPATPATPSAAWR